MSFVLAVFPPTGILGAGQFVFDGGLRSWLGWTQLVTVIGQVVVLYLLRQTVVQQTDLITSDDAIKNQTTQPLFVIATVLLIAGLGQYLYGVWRTWPTPASRGKSRVVKL